MATHRHWSNHEAVQPVVTETAIPAVAVTPTPQTVWTACYRAESSDEPRIRVFPTAGDCERWRLALARDNYGCYDEDYSEEANADAYFDDEAYFEVDSHSVKPYNG